MSRKALQQKASALERALQESSAYLKTILDALPVAVVTIDSAGIITDVNPPAERMFEYPAGLMAGLPLSQLIPERFRTKHQELHEDYQESPRPRPMGALLDLLALTRSGREFPVEVALSPSETSAGRRVIAVVTDISERRMAQLEVINSRNELRALNERLVRAQEEERSALARELHDEVTQMLSFLSVDLGRLATDALEFETALRGLQQKVKDVARGVREISHRLHPSILEDLGLEEALRYFCEEFAARQGIRVVFQCDEVPKLSREVELCLYRVSQEALQNAARHANTDRVEVHVRVETNQITLKVRDQGSGFRLDGPKGVGVGLVGMRERAAAVGATLVVESSPTKGTSVILRVPL